MELLSVNVNFFREGLRYLIGATFERKNRRAGWLISDLIQDEPYPVFDCIFWQCHNIVVMFSIPILKSLVDFNGLFKRLISFRVIAIYSLPRWSNKYFVIIPACQVIIPDLIVTSYIGIEYHAGAVHE
jgi:hypothetical protein